ncbi:hypothetical protein HDK77DRAFT_491512 [Phyllosticta capitalensis]
MRESSSEHLNYIEVIDLTRERVINMPPATSGKMACEGGGPNVEPAEKSSDHGSHDDSSGIDEASPPPKKRRITRPKSTSSEVQHHSSETMQRTQNKDEGHSVDSPKTEDPADLKKAANKASKEKVEGMTKGISRALQATKAAQVAKLKKIEGLEEHHAAFTKLYAGVVAVQEACEAFPEFDDIDHSIEIVIRSGDDLKDWEGAFEVLEEAGAKLNKES